MLADLCVAVLFVMHFPQDIFKTLADKRRVCKSRDMNVFRFFVSIQF